MLSSPDPFSWKQKTFENYDENPVHQRHKVKRIGSAVPQNYQFVDYNSGID